MALLASPNSRDVHTLRRTADADRRSPRAETTTDHPIALFRDSQTVCATATTEQLLRYRDDLPAEHLARSLLRARVIEENLPMANKLARRYVGRGEPFDDLAQVAAAALIKAVDGYDLSRQIPFAGYAIPSILGALKRHFRDAAWGMRVPRSVQELARQLPVATNDLSLDLGRPPTQAELASHLRVSVDNLVIAAGARHAYRPQSLDVPLAGHDSARLIDLMGDIDPHYARIDDHLSLRPLLAALPLRERRILAMRFSEQLSQSRIAAEFGLSQMQISRLLRQSLARLRAAMPH